MGSKKEKENGKKKNRLKEMTRAKDEKEQRYDSTLTQPHGLFLKGRRSDERYSRDFLMRCYFITWVRVELHHKHLCPVGKRHQCQD